MSIDAAEYARLSADSYEDRSKLAGSDKSFTLRGSSIEYTVLAVANNPKTDYQGTVYQRVDTKEVIIAHRGTESAKDGLTDASMVFTGRNNQLDDAVAFTEQAIALARKNAKDNNTPLNISLTGHSLGGTLAEITAARTGLHAETFNAYGPGALKNLDRYGVDVHTPHPNIVNHVRATDVVGAGGPHLGSTRTYAAPQDIENLKRGRYIGASPLPANPLLAADVGAHTITNFLPDNEVIGDSVLSANNEARGRAYASAIEHYKNDVVRGRVDLNKVANNAIPMASAVNGVRLGVQVADAASTAVAEKATQAMVSGAQTAVHGAQAVGHAAGQAYDATSTAVVDAAKTTGKAVVSGAQAASHAAERAYDAARDTVETGARQAGEALERTGEALHEGASRAIDKLTHPGSWFSSQTGPVPLLNDGQHPGNGFYKQALAGLEKINVERGIPTDQRTRNAAGTLAASACESRFEQIDHVALGSNGSKLIAVQGTPGTAHSKVIDVPTVQAMNTSLEDSSRGYLQAMNKATPQQPASQSQTQQLAQPVMLA
ncbi:XVIPCD domain-containing protein [Variovorax sp. AFSI2.2]|uniref:XVIPCD domain-containing protein n=1 Tax=Variovorax sp. AFSI2.2 TaxID=3384160 RepID=UPI003EC0E29D